MFTLPTQLLDVVKQAMGKHINMFDNHAIRVELALISTLGRKSARVPR